MRRFALCALIFTACGGPDTTDEGAGIVGDIDTSATGIAAYVKEKKYAGWTAEAMVHDSTGPHGKVKTFFNDTLKASLMANNAMHPKGSASVKELYQDDGTTIDGYAVMVKIADGATKETWIWWEGFNPELSAAYYGKGIGTCEGCHSSGKDRVRSALP